MEKVKTCSCDFSWYIIPTYEWRIVMGMWNGNGRMWAVTTPMGETLSRNFSSLLRIYGFLSQRSIPLLHLPSSHGHFLFIFLMQICVHTNLESRRASAFRPSFHSFFFHPSNRYKVWNFIEWSDLKCSEQNFEYTKFTSPFRLEFFWIKSQIFTVKRRFQQFQIKVFTI